MSQNDLKQKFFTIGDLSRAISDTLIDDATGSAIDLTGKTVAFRMVKADGTLIVSNAAATVDSAVDGEVSYAWQSADMTSLVDKDICFAWWIVTSAAKTEHFPGDGKKLQINWVGVP